jgi:L-amino acid N-acyltransferase YncA
MINEMYSSNGQRVLDIYEIGIKTRNATFETSIPTWDEWDSRHIKHSRFVYEENGIIIGWVALSPVSSRNAYKGVAEVSIYVDLSYARQGIGTMLMERAIKSSEENGIWTLQSSVFPENIATLRLHEKFGFRVVGKREKIATLDGIWRDTLIFERRSIVVGN